MCDLINGSTVDCPVGMYLSVIRNECHFCPENSESEVPGLTECPCLDGYHRAPGEVDLACTRKSETG